MPGSPLAPRFFRCGSFSIITPGEGFWGEGEGERISSSSSRREQTIRINPTFSSGCAPEPHALVFAPRGQIAAPPVPHRRSRGRFKVMKVHISSR